MAYIGKSPTGTGVRQRYYFTATGGETSLSGTDDNGLTLSYSDGAYVDVLLNGIELVAGTDYNTSTANTIAGLSALAASDIVTVTVYDIFTVADTVSANTGGTFKGNVTMQSDLTVDTDTLYVDSTNDRVGVGTSSPAYKFHQHENTSDANYHLFTNSTTGSTSSDGLRIGIDSNENALIWHRENNDLIFATNNTEAMRIDSSGRVTMPYQPMCSVSKDNGDISTTGAVVGFNNTEVNVGNHYSTATGRFTAPVAGYYKVDTSILSGNGALVGASIRKNNSDYYKIEYSDSHNFYVQISGTAIINCAAGDYITINHKNGTIYGGGGKYTVMTVQLIG